MNIIIEENKVLKIKTLSLEETIKRIVERGDGNQKSSRSNEYKKQEQYAKAQHDHRGNSHQSVLGLKNEND